VVRHVTRVGLLDLRTSRNQLVEVAHDVVAALPKDLYLLHRHLDQLVEVA